MSLLAREKSETTDRVLLLKNDPELAARQSERDVEETSGRKQKVEQEVQRLKSRTDEMTLLGL